MIRGLLIVLFSILLFGSIFAVNVSWDLSSSLKYSNVTQGINISNDNQTIQTFMISPQSGEYLDKIFYAALSITILLIIILFLLFIKKQNISFLVGSLTILASLLLLGIQRTITGFPNMISNIFLIFFSQTDYVFIRMITIGIAIFCIGLIINLVEVGFRIYDFLRVEHRHKLTPILLPSAGSPFEFAARARLSLSNQLSCLAATLKGLNFAAAILF